MERRGWFEQMFCGARTVKTVPYSAFYNVRQYLWCTPPVGVHNVRPLR